MNIKPIILLVFSGYALSLSGFGHAGMKRGGEGSPEPCPPQVIADMDSQFGVGTSELTTCIQEKNDLKIVFAWNLATINSRTGLGQQVQVTRNTVNNYENLYSMQINSNFEMIAVGYAGGGRWLLTDEAFNRSYQVSSGNPSASLVESLISRGVEVYMCQNTMRGNGWQTSDLLPGVKMVPAGVVGIIDYQHLGYKYINP